MTRHQWLVLATENRRFCSRGLGPHFSIGLPVVIRVSHKSRLVAYGLLVSYRAPLSQVQLPGNKIQVQSQYNQIWYLIAVNLGSNYGALPPACWLDVHGRQRVLDIQTLESGSRLYHSPGLEHHRHPKICETKIVYAVHESNLACPRQKSGLPRRRSDSHPHG
jgi:hypothetical protein